MSAPRKADDALADALGVSTETAAALRRRALVGPGYVELDAELRAEAALADLNAARSLDAEDVADAAASDDPLSALDDTLTRRSERELRARLAAHASWAVTENPSARTKPAREAFDARFEREVDPEGRLSPAERQRRASHARKAYFLRLALKSAQVRKARRA